MQFESICKFNYNRSSDLICLNFILEAENALAKPVRSQRHAIHIVKSGTGVLRCHGRTTPLQRGTVFFIQEGETFSIESRDQLQYYYIHFHGRRGDEYLQRLNVDDQNRVFPSYESLLPFWEDCHQIAENGNIDILCEAVLLYTVAKLRPDKKENNDVVAKIVTLTHENFSDPNLSITAIAQKLGYDAKYLSSVFKKRKGVPFTQYLRQLRLKHAVFLMEQGLVSVKNIALLSGFSDALYFSKLFTQSEGISPKAYIQKVSQADVSDGEDVTAQLFSQPEA